MSRIAITALVVIHLAATLWQGDAHTRLAIDLPPAKNIFVLVVILAAPIVAAGLVWTKFSSIGLWMFVISMLGALLFGAYPLAMYRSLSNLRLLDGYHPMYRRLSNPRLLAGSFAGVRR